MCEKTYGVWMFERLKNSTNASLRLESKGVKSAKYYNRKPRKR